MNFTKDQVASCVNSTAQSCLGASPTPTDALLYLIVTVVIFVTVFGNLLVTISICHFKQLHTPTNLLILSLAMADFLVGVTVMPFYFALLLKPNWCFGAVYCIICHVSSFHLTCVSIYNVAFISVDRYFALSNPFLYCTKMTVNLTVRILCVLWLFSFIYNVVLLHVNGNFFKGGNVTCPMCIATMNEIWTIFDFVTVFILPCTTIVIMYLKIFAIAKRHATKINLVKKQHTKSTKLKNFSMASERKAAKTLGILVSVFLLCLVPFYITAFVAVYVRKTSVYLVLLNTTTLIYVNSSINPIIYALFYPWFQKSIKLILTLKICNSQSSLMNVLVKET